MKIDPAKSKPHASHQVDVSRNVINTSDSVEETATAYLAAQGSASSKKLQNTSYPQHTAGKAVRVALSRLGRR